MKRELKTQSLVVAHSYTPVVKVEMFSPRYISIIPILNTYAQTYFDSSLHL